MRQNWLLGAGLAGYQTALQPYHQNAFIEIFLYPHNIFLNFWSELGLAGMLAFMSFLAYLLTRLWRQKNPDGLVQGLLLAFVALFIHGLVDVPYFRNDLSLLFFLLAAVSLSLLRFRESIPATDN